MVKTGVTREERSEEQTRETSWEYEWETAAARDDERYDFVSRDDGKMLDSRERRKRETVRELVQKLRTWNRGRGAKSVRGSGSVL